MIVPISRSAVARTGGTPAVAPRHKPSGSGSVSGCALVGSYVSNTFANSHNGFRRRRVILTDAWDEIVDPYSLCSVCVWCRWCADSRMATIASTHSSGDMAWSCT